MVTDPKKAKAIANETRIRILQEIGANSQSISQLARKIGISPVAVLYHIKILKNTGYIRLAKTTVVNNNLTEKFYEITTAAYFVVVSGVDQPVKGPVPPKKHGPKLIIGITPADVEKTFDLLGLTYLAENKAHVEGNMIKLIEMAVLEAGEVQKEILNQSNLKLSAADRAKIEYVAMAVLPIVLDKLLGKQETLECLRSVIERLQKKQ
jgi:DNA-binding transcriptional ArsR family regulator